MQSFAAQKVARRDEVEAEAEADKRALVKAWRAHINPTTATMVSTARKDQIAVLMINRSTGAPPVGRGLSGVCAAFPPLLLLLRERAFGAFIE